MDKVESSAEIHLLYKVKWSSALGGVFPPIILIYWYFLYNLKTSVMVVVEVYIKVCCLTSWLPSSLKTFHLRSVLIVIQECRLKSTHLQKLWIVQFISQIEVKIHLFAWSFVALSRNLNWCQTLNFVKTQRKNAYQLHPNLPDKRK